MNEEEQPDRPDEPKREDVGLGDADGGETLTPEEVARVSGKDARRQAQDDASRSSSPAAESTPTTRQAAAVTKESPWARMSNPQRFGGALLIALIAAAFGVIVSQAIEDDPRPAPPDASRSAAEQSEAQTRVGACKKDVEDLKDLELPSDEDERSVGDPSASLVARRKAAEVCSLTF